MLRRLLIIQREPFISSDGTGRVGFGGVDPAGKAIWERVMDPEHRADAEPSIHPPTQRKAASKIHKRLPTPLIYPALVTNTDVPFEIATYCKKHAIDIFTIWDGVK